MATSIYDKDMLGRSKYATAIERIKCFCAGKKVVLAFSGGKDSQVCYHLLEDAGIDFTAQYSVTRFEPPELIKFIRTNYPSVIFRHAYKMSLVEEITYRGLPNMFARWCCAAKHAKIEGFDVVILGIRWAESAKRANNWGMSGYKKDKSFYLCPIIEWTDTDVWEYLADRPHCSLYDEGFKRIGCVCCPLSPRKMQDDITRWPKTARMLRMGADSFVSKMRGADWKTGKGKTCTSWHLNENPEQEYWHRWVTTGQTSKAYNPNLDEAQCLFAGTGFSESDTILEPDESEL